MSNVVLVTGAAGYIGRHVVTSLVNRGATVIALVLKDTTFESEVTTVVADIFDPSFSLANYTNLVPDTCIHLAWNDGFNHKSLRHLAELSLHYTFLSNLIDSGIKNINVMGTMHEIGFYEGAVNAETPRNPQSLYGVAKCALFNALEAKRLYDEFSFKWLRAYYILGDDIKNNSVFGKILIADNEGKQSFPFTSGKNKFDFVQVDNLAEMIVSSSLQTEITGVIECCTGEPVSLGDKMEEFILTNHLSISLDYGAYPDRPYDSPAIWGDPTLINRILSKNPKS